MNKASAQPEFWYTIVVWIIAIARCHFFGQIMSLHLVCSQADISSNLDWLFQWTLIGFLAN
jgi:hypothetical protein